jgi:hypothetical protein
VGHETAAQSSRQVIQACLTPRYQKQVDAMLRQTVGNRIGGACDRPRLSTKKPLDCVILFK